MDTECGTAEGKYALLTGTLLIIDLGQVLSYSWSM